MQKVLAIIGALLATALDRDFPEAVRRRKSVPECDRNQDSSEIAPESP